SSFGVGERVLARHEGEARLASRYAFNVTALTRSLSGVYQGLALLALVAGIWLVSGQSSNELSSLGAVIVLLLRALNYGQSFQMAQHNVNENLPFVDQVRQQIDAYHAEERRAGATPLPTMSGLSFDGVTFSHGEGPPALHDVSFEISAGEAIGV